MLSNNGATGTYLAFSMPGSSNSNTLFGQTRSNIASLFTATSVNDSGNGRIFALGTVNNNAVLFGTDNSKRMRITASGTIGIGTTSPNGQFDVESSQNYSGYFNNTATVSADAVYAATASTTTSAAVFGTITGAANMGYAGYFTNTATSGTNYAVYANNAAASGYGVYASNSNSSGLALFCSSSYPSGCGGNEGWFNSSDIRLKAGIAELSPARGLDAVMKLRPVTFHWKNPAREQGQRIGLIAQEVERLYPEAVGTEPDGMKTISYGDLVVPLIKAVQEQQAEIAALRAANDNLQAEVAALKAEKAY
jgi:trimeric autotransporter adhesin